MSVRNPHRSKTVLVCPLTGNRTTRFLDGDAPGQFVTVVDGTADDLITSLPPGWGRLVIERVIMNPEIDEIDEDRRAAAAEGFADLEAVLASEAPEAEKAILRRRINDGSVQVQIDDAVATQHPYPEDEVVVQRLVFSALSDNAITTICQVLRQLGLPVVVEDAVPAEVEEAVAAVTGKVEDQVATGAHPAEATTLLEPLPTGLPPEVTK